MTIRRILIPTSPESGGRLRLEVALGLSRRLEAHIKMLFIRADPERTYRGLPEVIRSEGATAQQIDIEGIRKAQESKAAFARFCSDAGIRSDGKFEDLHATFGDWVEQVGELEPIIALAGRVSDLLVIDPPTAADATSERIFDAAVFSTGRPALVVVPNYPDDLLRHVVVAWNGSLEAARLVGHSLDLLRAATRVSIITTATERSTETAVADLGDYLMWHGIRAHQLMTSAASDDVAKVILETVTRVEATMLIMGAYTHSRIRQFLFGGVTHHVLSHAKIPVLMEH